jgi:hypothetical protein
MMRADGGDGSEEASRSLGVAGVGSGGLTVHSPNRPEKQARGDDGWWAVAGR